MNLFLTFELPNVTLFLVHQEFCLACLSIQSNHLDYSIIGIVWLGEIESAKIYDYFSLLMPTTIYAPIGLYILCA